VELGTGYKLLIKEALIIGVLAALAVTSNGGTDTDTASITPRTSTGPANSAVSESSSATLPPAPAPTTGAQAACHTPANGYSASGRSCYPGGELVTIAKVIDGDTLTLNDGREIQLIAIDAPELDDCAGPAAADYVRSKVDGQAMQLHREPGVDRDKSGRLLAYLRYEPSHYVNDLAYDLTRAGWATPFPGNPGNAEVMDDLQSAHEIAQASDSGQFGPTCVRNQRRPAAPT
jgi:endonuclease YncB( thermonuclease family)